MRKIGISSAVAAAFAVTALVPTAAASAASAAPTHYVTVSPNHTFNCSTGRVEAIEDTPVFEGPGTGSIIEILPGGGQINCVQGITLGARYSQCGVSNGNGYILVNIGLGHGYVRQACLVDQ